MCIGSVPWCCLILEAIIGVCAGQKAHMVEYRHACHGYMTCMAAAWKGRMLSWMHVQMSKCFAGVNGLFVSGVLCCTVGLCMRLQLVCEGQCSLLLVYRLLVQVAAASSHSQTRSGSVAGYRAARQGSWRGNTALQGVAVVSHKVQGEPSPVMALHSAALHWGRHTVVMCGV